MLLKTGIYYFTKFDNVTFLRKVKFLIVLIILVKNSVALKSVLYQNLMVYYSFNYHLPLLDVGAFNDLSFDMEVTQASYGGW